MPHRVLNRRCRSNLRRHRLSDGCSGWIHFSDSVVAIFWEIGGCFWLFFFVRFFFDRDEILKSKYIYSFFLFSIHFDSAPLEIVFIWFLLIRGPIENGCSLCLIDR